MNNERTMLVDAATDLFGDLCPPAVVVAAEETGWAGALWSALAEAGFPWVGVPEQAGGSGGSLADACALLQVVGRYAAPVPLAETGVLAGWALASAGLALPSGPATVGVGRPDDVVELAGGPGSWRLSARVGRVPWGGECERLVLLADLDRQRFVVSVPREGLTVTPGRNLAGEPRDALACDDTALPDDAVAPASDHVTVQTLAVRGALTRAALIAGALSRVSDLTVTYTEQRQQFGRPIARFQAVQQHLVQLAEQAQSARMAVLVAAQNADPEPAVFDVAAAKVVASEAATSATRAAHQAHGAIGMTKEYELGQLTRRLWSWREEFGSDRYWSRELGDRLADADALWPRIAVGLVRG